MHEYGLASEIVDAALAAAEGARIRRVLVDCGPRSGADPSTLMAAFQIAAAGTPAAGAVLELAPAADNAVVITAIDVDE